MAASRPKGLAMRDVGPGIVITKVRLTRPDGFMRMGMSRRTIRKNKACAEVSWRDSAGHQSCPAKVSRPAGIDVDVSGGNEWCEASRIADGQPQRK